MTVTEDPQANPRVSYTRTGGVVLLFCSTCIRLRLVARFVVVFPLLFIGFSELS